ncbi:putative high affinity immunoglobulin gamma Fc receptor IC [Periophthalmus magnuspinnatus]|uniref:putative high affinity immunoglobulin gamma Fc receptor IC n=1 Tax=Periophthalmus magnuspinnatus TaxID=409849 RepID=UPI00145BB0FC|nr:putative high affinity immunoglobulin gamma Fc receptor IC [Periophthalmus magnuspinnatus]
MDSFLQGSLLLSPDQSQFFLGRSLNLRCDDPTWKVWRRNRNTRRRCDTAAAAAAAAAEDREKWGVQSGPWCIIKYLEKKDSGQYWCQTEGGDASEPVQISVSDSGAILQMPVRPVSTGQTVKLICQNLTSLTSSARFYKNGDFLSEQPSGQMILQQVALSDKGMYQCETEGQRSLQSELRVEAAIVTSTLATTTHSAPTPAPPSAEPPPSFSLLLPVVGSVVGVVFLIVVVLLVLLIKRCRCKKKTKGKRHRKRGAPPLSQTTGTCSCTRTTKTPRHK